MFHSCSEFAQIPRRKLLQIGGAGLLGLNLPRLLRAAEQPANPPAAKAKSVVFLYQFGGPSHIDMLDMKPDAPEGIRGPLKPAQSSLPGVTVCEQMPEVAKIMDRVTLIRSMTHTMKNHNSAAYYALTGRAPPSDDIRLKDSLELFPAYGSIVDRLTPPVAGLPTFVAYPYVLRDGAVTPGQHASFLGKRHDPFLVTEDPNGANFKLPELSLPANLSAERMRDRRALQQLIDRQSRLLDDAAVAQGIDEEYQKAIGMLNVPKIRQAFDLTKESEKTRDRYGRTPYGQSCLLARRLVEAGVRFVNVYFSEGIGGQSTTAGGWDTHGFNNTRMFPIVEKYHLPLTNQTLPAFLLDLEERGLLDTTLVVWMGEFGRTPKINENVSRDHWPQCYTALLAGGGVKRGYVHGASDRDGAHPARDPVRPDDLAATMFHLLGISPQTEVYDGFHRPLPIAAGDVVQGVLA
ncbi:MAG TPA: DUF1501 domain-containing protein [Pirellulales bacterium]|jgi:hypothetical protein|nr:DUF1501 domain-containing protein [Pirellulales bacterium]